MKRKIIEIDEVACTAAACAFRRATRARLGLVAGKARLLRDDYCDGLGDCPARVPDRRHRLRRARGRSLRRGGRARGARSSHRRGCRDRRGLAERGRPRCAAPLTELTTWPVEIKLAPVRASCFQGAHVLIAADCTAFAYADFHRDFFARAGRPRRLPEAGCRRLQPEARGCLRGQRHRLGHRGAHGGSVLRRA